MLGGASGCWPSAPSSHCAAGGRASRSLAAPSTCSRPGGRPSSEKRNVLSPSYGICIRAGVSTYANADKDHLDVAEHLRDADEDVQ